MRRLETGWPSPLFVLEQRPEWGEGPTARWAGAELEAEMPDPQSGGFSQAHGVEATPFCEPWECGRVSGSEPLLQTG